MKRDENRRDNIYEGKREALRKVREAGGTREKVGRKYNKYLSSAELTYLSMCPHTCI